MSCTETFYIKNLEKIFCQENIEHEKNVILELIKEALDVYGESGMLSKYTYHNKYNF